MAIWPRFHRSSEAKAAAAPEAPVNERTGRESERSGGGGGGGGGMTGGRGVSEPLQHRRLFVPRNPPAAPHRPHLGLKLSAPNSHFINQDDPSSCEFISLCAG